MSNAPLSQIIQAAETELTHMNTAPFSTTAFDAIRTRVSKYAAELVAESARIGRRHHADTVSADHVHQAAVNLVSDSNRKFYRHLGTIGGILLGAAMGNLLSMVSTNQFTIISVSATAGMGIVGSFLVALHIARE